MSRFYCGPKSSVQCQAENSNKLVLMSDRFIPSRVKNEYDDLPVHELLCRNNKNYSNFLNTFTKKGRLPAFETSIISKRKNPTFLFPFHVENDLVFDDNYYYNVMDYTKGIVALGLSDGSIKLFNEDLALQLTHYTLSKRNVMSVCLAIESNLMLYSNKSEPLSIFDLNKEKSTLFFNFNFPINCIRQLDQNQYVLSNPNGYLGVHDIRIKKVENYFKHHDAEICNIVCYDSNRIVSGSNDNKVNIYDLRRGSDSSCKVSSYSHNSGIKGLDTNEKYIISGGGNHDRTIKVYSMKQQKVIISQLTENQVTGIRILNFDLLAVSYGYSDNNIQIFRIDFSNKKLDLVINLEPHVKRILNLCASSNKSKLFSSSSDGQIRLWKIPREINNSSHEEKLGLKESIEDHLGTDDNGLLR